ncbi:MAG: CRISPR-associated endoribonuclease Cas6 [Bacteroidetes bacterium]|nr:MAG: CRISPR-associated endoribonuclease Cas6 [Bacteroidota bacterium]
MRLHFSLTPNIQTIPFDYQHFLIGVFHKWMGWNVIHDEISLYSLSWLQNGKMTTAGLDFSHGAKWFISFWDEEMCRQLVTNAMNNPDVFYGMVVKEIQMQETPNFSGKEKFILSSPVFIRKYDENRKAIHLTYKDEEANYYLTETIKKKLSAAHLDYDVKIYFDKNYNASKTKLVKINGIENKANFCPVIVEGNPEAVKFAWNVGIGHSTGSGFGAIY